MSKIEDRALEKYPVHSILIVPARGGGYYADSHLREGFIEGYHQAEKDLELTWEDMQLIGEIQFSICYYEYKGKRLPPRKQIYNEVLKRFNKERKENEIRK